MKLSLPQNRKEGVKTGWNFVYHKIEKRGGKTGWNLVYHKIEKRVSKQDET